MDSGVGLDAVVASRSLLRRDIGGREIKEVLDGAGEVCVSKGERNYVIVPWNVIT